MKTVLVYGMTSNPGGIESYVHGMFDRMQGELVQFDFVSDFPSISGAERLTARGAKLHFIPAKGTDLKGHIKGLWQILRQHPEYETVYFNVLDAGSVITMLVPFLLGRKIVAHSHSSSTDKMKLHKLCKPLLNGIVKGRLSCSDAASEFMFGKNKDVLVVPNAIDTKQYAFSQEVRTAKRAELQLGDRPVFCHVGRITPAKNPFGLIDIFEAVHKRCPEAVLLSVGDGELKEEFKAYIAKKQLKDSVRLLGVRHDVPELLTCADVFLFPSIFEGLPISLVEAQASGIPCVISTAIPAQATITDVVCAIPLEKSPDIWADEILKRINQPHKDTYAQIVSAGFDISCIQEYDKKLMQMF